MTDSTPAAAAAATPQPHGAEEIELTPPTARQVAARALVVSAVVCRGFIDSGLGKPGMEAMHGRLLNWLHRLGLAEAIEPAELETLQAPLGTLPAEERVDATWQGECLAVLAWALGRYELPAFDAAVDPADVNAALGFLSDAPPPLAAGVRLRPSAEIDGLAERLFAAHWRLKRFDDDPKPLEFVAAAADPQLGLKLEGLPLSDGDLAVRGKALTALPEAERLEVLRIVTERHRAANWLAGYSGFYAEPQVG
jgi:hypothetical protein